MKSQLDLVRLRGHILVAKLSTVRGKSAWQRQRITKFRAAAEIKAGTRKAQARNNRAGKAAEIRRAALKPTPSGWKGGTSMARKSKDKGGEKTKPPKKLSKKSG
jgi:hypothetical protein